MRLGGIAAVAVCLCCAAPASAQVSGGDDAEPDSGLLPPSGSASLSGTQQVGQTLTGSDNFSGASSIDRGWLRCNAGGTACSVISGQTSTTYALVNADADKVIKFRVRGTSLTGGVHEADAATGAIDAISPANGTAPSFTGRTTGGQLLTGNRGSWSGTPTIEYAYRWQRCSPGCVDIPGGAADDLNYTLASADVGQRVRLEVTATRSENGADTTTAVSPQSAVIAPVSNITLPGISGTAQRGQVLSAGTGTWAGIGPIIYAYSWERCTPGCAAIGAASSSYAPGVADVGHRLRVKITATGADGAASAFSAMTGVVTAAPSAGAGGGSTGGGGGTTTPGSTTLRRLSPFPVVAIGGRVIRRRVLISLLRVSRAPRGSVVTVTCKGRSCPFRRARRTVRRRAGLRIRGLERRLRAGTVITIIVRKGNTIGKYTRLRIRRGAPPARIDRCIRPGARRPSVCP